MVSVKPSPGHTAGARISCQPHGFQNKSQPRRHIINTQLGDLEQSAYLRDLGGTWTGFLEPWGIAWDGDTLSDAYFEWYDVAELFRGLSCLVIMTREAEIPIAEIPLRDQELEVTRALPLIIL